MPKPPTSVRSIRRAKLQTQADASDQSLNGYVAMRLGADGVRAAG